MHRKAACFLCTLWLFGCGSTHPHRVNTASSMLYTPMLGGEIDPEPGEVTEELAQGFRLGVGGGYGTGGAYTDGGALGLSDNFYARASLKPTLVSDWTFGALLFLSGSKHVGREDRMSSGVGIWAGYRLYREGRWSAEFLPSVRYSANTNDDTNCDGDLLGGQPTDANGRCLVTWSAHAEVRWASLQLVLPLTYQLGQVSELVLAPGILGDTIDSANRLTGAPDIVHEKTHWAPMGMIFLRLSPNRLRFQIGAGATRLPQFGTAMGSKPVYFSDISLSLSR